MSFRNNSIDILKFILAYEVVMLHCSQAPYAIIRPVVDSAVPCFLMISGYLIYSEDRNRYSEKLKRAIRKISIILLWSTLLCGFDDLYRLIVYQEIGNFNLVAITNFLLFNENPFAFHLWYISAYLYALLFFNLIKRIDLPIRIWWILGLWLIGICLVVGNALVYHCDLYLIYVRNFLFQGIPYMGMGLLLKKYEKFFAHTSIWQLVLGWCFVVFAAIVEKRIESFSFGTYVFSGIIAFYTLLLFSRIGIERSSLISEIGKKYGLYVYIFHPFLMKVFISPPIIHIIGYSPYVYPTLVFVGTLFLVNICRLLFVRIRACLWKG